MHGIQCRKATLWSGFSVFACHSSLNLPPLPRRVRCYVIASMPTLNADDIRALLQPRNSGEPPSTPHHRTKHNQPIDHSNYADVQTKSFIQGPSPWSSATTSAPQPIQDEPPKLLWCEFRGILGCEATFDFDDDSRWIQHHSLEHLDGKLPYHLGCWFCDELFSDAPYTDLRDNFELRMAHIRWHIFDDNLTADHMAVDANMVEHALAHQDELSSGTVDHTDMSSTDIEPPMPPEPVGESSLGCSDNVLQHTERKGQHCPTQPDGNPPSSSQQAGESPMSMDKVKDVIEAISRSSELCSDTAKVSARSPSSQKTGLSCLPSRTSSPTASGGKESLDSELLSMSEDLDLVDDTSPESPSHLVLSTAVDRVVRDFYFQRNHLPREAPESAYPTGSRSSGSTFTGGGSSSSSAPKRGRENEARDKGKGHAEDDNKRDGKHPQKRARTSGSQMNAPRSLACPFWKHSPFDQHRACYRYKLSRIRDVKQHLVRKHTPTHYCQRCFQIFEGERNLENHIETETCQRVPGSHLDGITPAVDSSLRRRANPNQSIEEQWFAIWDLIFPGKKRPFSPYIDPVLSNDLFNFREYWQNHAHDVLDEVLRLLDQRAGSNISDADRQINGQRILIMGMNRIYEAWSSNHSGSSSATASSPRAQVRGSTGSTTDGGVDAGVGTSNTATSEEDDRVSGEQQIGTESESWPMSSTFGFGASQWLLEPQAGHRSNPLAPEAQEYELFSFDAVFGAHNSLMGGRETFRSLQLDSDYGG